MLWLCCQYTKHSITFTTTTLPLLLSGRSVLLVLLKLSLSTLPSVHSTGCLSCSPAVQRHILVTTTAFKPLSARVPSTAHVTGASQSSVATQKPFTAELVQSTPIVLPAGYSCYVAHSDTTAKQAADAKSASRLIFTGRFWLSANHPLTVRLCTLSPHLRPLHLPLLPLTDVCQCGRVSADRQHTARRSRC